MFWALQVLGAPENIEELAREITERLGKVEKQQVSRISYCYRVFARALKEKGSCAQLWHDGAEGTIRARVEEYFETSQPSMDFVGDDELPFYSLPATICGDVHAVSRMGLGPSSSRTLSGASPRSKCEGGEAGEGQGGPERDKSLRRHVPSPMSERLCIVRVFCVPRSPRHRLSASRDLVPVLDGGQVLRHRILGEVSGLRLR